jgi:hypothetical protein
VEAIMERRKPINIKKTILTSLWIYFVICFISGGALLYSAERLRDAVGIREICFWGFLAIIIVDKFCRYLAGSTFFVYKEEEKK